MASNAVVRAENHAHNVVDHLHKYTHIDLWVQIRRRIRSSLDLELTQERGLLLLGLELSVTELGRSIDELELNVLDVG